MILLLGCSTYFIADAIAGPREDAVSAMKRCDSLADNKAWLDCHDAASAQLRAAIQAPLGGGARPSGNRSVSGAALPQQLGQEYLPPARINPTARGRADRLTAKVSTFTFSSTGYFTVELDNGQVWRQVDGDTNYARFRTPVSRNLVNIEHGFLGSYNLHIRGKGQGYKVRRIR